MGRRLITLAPALLIGLSLLGCDDPEASDDAGRTDAGERRDAGPDAGDAPSVDAGELSDASGEDAGPPDVDAGPPDPCEGAAFCERFDDYGTVSLSDGAALGPWTARHRDPSSLDVDETRARSGGALHIRIDDTGRAGGRLFSDTSLPVLAGRPTRLYARYWMYVGDNGVSTHWTHLGFLGPALAPLDGRQATYLFSSLRTDDQNQFSAVNYINTTPAQDCWNRSPRFIESGRWMCLSFEVDSEARRLRMSIDDEATPSLSVDETGMGCVGDVANDSPWIGPEIEQLYIGAWSFHPVTGPLEVWIDDLAVDDEPLPCPGGS